MKKILFILLLLASPAYGEIYTWTDTRGTTHYTNSEYDIPEKYRAKRKILNLGIAEKKESTSPQQNATPQQNTPPQQTLQLQPVKQAPAPSAERSRKRRHGSRAHNENIE